MAVSITTFCNKCHHAECRCGEYRDLFIVMLNVVMLSTFMLNVVMPSVIVLSIMIYLLLC
jgi:hypothetical protein